MSDTAPIDAWVEAAEAELSRLASEMEAGVRSSLDAPYAGPSSPGEPPRRRTGNLQAGVTVTVARDGRTITLTIDSAAPYSAAVEATRPFVSPALAEWAPEILSRLQSITVP